VILFEITNDEASPAYQTLEIANGNRHYDFLRSMVLASLETKRHFLSQAIIKALNYHAIACLHVAAGEFRPCPVYVGKYHPPEHFRVQALMDDLVNQVNRSWETSDPVVLATYVLWRINHIHPFINGNGRTARASAYFVLCVAAGSWLPGEITLPGLLRRNRDEYVAALQSTDESQTAGNLDLSTLHALVSRLLSDQLSSGGIIPANGNGS
jgi:Fic family protein